MKKLYVYGLILISAGLAFSAYIVDARRGSFVSADGLRSEIPEFDPASAQSFKVTSGARSVTVSRDGAYWVVADRDNAQADTAYVADFLSSVSSIRPLKEMDASSESSLRELGLSEDSQDHIKVEFFDSAGKQIHILELGGAHYRREAEQIGGMSVSAPDARYIAVRDSRGAKRVFMISRIFMKCGPSPSVWLEPMRFGSITEPLHMRYLVSGSDGKLSPVWWVLRSAADSDSYTFAYPPENAGVVSLPKISEMLKMVSSPMSLNILPSKAAERFRPGGVFQCVLLNGLSYTLEFQTQDGSPVAYARLTVEFSIDKVRRVHGESLEAFELRRGQLEKRAAFEKRIYDGRVFVVRSEIPSKLSEIPSKK